MSLLAIWKITEGALLTPFASLLAIWFGWGSFIIIAAIGYFGYSLLQQERGDVHWGQIISLEIASLLTLGLVSVAMGNDLVRAEAGMDGGRLGWGLATLASQTIGSIWGTLVLFILWAFSIMIGFGSVSYTHLTLPTSDLVKILVLAVASNKINALS